MSVINECTIKMNLFICSLNWVCFQKKLTNNDCAMLNIINDINKNNCIGWTSSFFDGCNGNIKLVNNRNIKL